MLPLTDDQKLEIAIAYEKNGIFSAMAILNLHLGYILPLTMRRDTVKLIYKEISFNPEPDFDNVAQRQADAEYEGDHSNY